jgi:hypothetical protein
MPKFMTKAGGESYKKWCENVLESKRRARANNAVLRRVTKACERSTRETLAMAAKLEAHTRKRKAKTA